MNKAKLITIIYLCKYYSLPNEIVDEILIYYTDFVSAIKLGCSNYVSNALYKPTIHTWEYAALNGHTQIIKWLHFNNKQGYTFKVINNASRNGHIKIVKWLHKNRKENYSKEAINWAAMNGHFDIVKFLYDNKIGYCSHSAITWAGLNGHTKIVKYLHNNKT